VLFYGGGGREFGGKPMQLMQEKKEDSGQKK